MQCSKNRKIPINRNALHCLVASCSRIVVVWTSLKSICVHNTRLNCDLHQSVHFPDSISSNLIDFNTEILPPSSSPEYVNGAVPNPRAGASNAVTSHRDLFDMSESSFCCFALTKIPTGGFVQSWSTFLVEGDEQQGQPSQQAIQSMKIKGFLVSAVIDCTM